MSDVFHVGFLVGDEIADRGSLKRGEWGFRLPKTESVTSSAHATAIVSADFAVPSAAFDDCIR